MKTLLSKVPDSRRQSTLALGLLASGAALIALTVPLAYVFGILGWLSLMAGLWLVWVSAIWAIFLAVFRLSKRLAHPKARTASAPATALELIFALTTITAIIAGTILAHVTSPGSVGDNRISYVTSVLLTGAILTIIRL